VTDTERVLACLRVREAAVSAAIAALERLRDVEGSAVTEKVLAMPALKRLASRPPAA
jgi:hypothetical protein